jgi:hypothetical protein
LRKESADQELEAEIVDPLAVVVVDGARRGHPAVDQPVAHGERQCHEPVVAGGVLRVLADLVDQLAENGLPEAFLVEAERGKADNGLGHGTSWTSSQPVGLADATVRSTPPGARAGVKWSLPASSG